MNTKFLSVFWITLQIKSEIGWLLWEKSSADLGEQRQDTDRHLAFELIYYRNHMSLYMIPEDLEDLMCPGVK